MIRVRSLFFFEEDCLPRIIRGLEEIPQIFRRAIIPVLLEMVDFAKSDHLFTNGDAPLVLLEQSAMMIEKVGPQVLRLRSIRDAFAVLECLTDDQRLQIKSVIAKAIADNDKSKTLEQFLQKRLGARTRPRQIINVKTIMTGGKSRSVRCLGSTTFYYLLESLRVESFIVVAPINIDKLMDGVSFYWGAQQRFPVHNISVEKQRYPGSSERYLERAIFATKGENNFLTKVQPLPDGKNWAIQVDLHQNGNN